VNKNIAKQQKWPEDLLIKLQELQGKFGYLSEEIMTELAESRNMPLNDIYGVASFYSFLSTKPPGRNVIRVCKCLPCYFKGGDSVMESLAKKLGIKAGETTPDGKFSLQLTNCIGLCDRAPAILINDDPHVDLTPAKIPQILKSYK
jgi:NADH-quinone oxidoreductase subunit E